MISLEQVRRVAIVTLEGPLDFESADSVKEAVNGLLREGRVHLILNFEKVFFVDSTGLGALLTAIQRVRKRGGEIRLCNLRSRIKSLLHLTKLSSIFPVFESIDEAKKNFGNPHPSGP